MPDFELVYIDRNEDGLITLWDSPGPGRIECCASVDMTNGLVSIGNVDPDAVQS